MVESKNTDVNEEMTEELNINEANIENTGEETEVNEELKEELTEESPTDEAIEEPEDAEEEAEEELPEVSELDEPVETEKSDAAGVGVVDSNDLLVALDDEKQGYLTHGVHIGLKYRTSDMRPFIYRIRPDKLCVFEVSKIDKRIKIAAKFISQFNPQDVLLVSNREYGRHPIKKFAEQTGCRAITKRYVSGTLTNPNIANYTEPKLLVITDPGADLQAIKEAAETGIATLAICDTNTRFKNLDFIIPGNNKGKNSIALIYWLLAREVSRIKGKEFDTPFEHFVSYAEPQPYLLRMQELQRMSRARQRGRKR
ncbi:MAG: 30S ribosomal protein S2 [Candidatus Altiarchaeales archaeon HGW-Altiarchaeales-3]|nr:MAG: 30S ribosomal protein S2 [Candidatus Altiarchaeales archaeon HGW-Altiarchaeales-3]